MNIWDLGKLSFMERVSFVIERVSFVIERVSFVIERVSFVIKRVSFIRRVLYHNFLTGVWYL